MHKIFAALGFLICMQLPVSASVIYTFSAGTGSNTLSFSATLPDFIQGGNASLPASALTSCTLQSSAPIGDFCAGAIFFQSGTAGIVSVEAGTPNDPTIITAGSAQFPGVTFAQAGSFTGTITSGSGPASLTIQAVAPEPGTFLSGGIAALCLVMLRLRSAKQRS